MTAISDIGSSRRFMRLARAERVAMIRFDDSNGALGGTGWNEHMASQLFSTAGLPLWSTDLFTQAEGGIGNPFNGIGLGWNVGIVTSKTNWVTTAGAAITTGIAAIDNHIDLRDSLGTSGSPNAGAYIAAGTPTINTQALSIQPGHPIVQLALDWHFQYGTFATGSGSFTPMVRNAGTPGFATITPTAGAGTRTTSPLTDAVVWDTVSIAADATQRNVNFKWQTQSTAMTAPVWFGWHHAVAPSVTTGLLHTNLISTGGWSLWDYLTTLQAAPDLTLSDYLSHIRSLAGPNKTICIVIQSGMNDTNDAARTSLGPNPTTPGDSQAAFADNLQGIINRFEAIYTAQGWARSQLYFMIQTAQPQPTTNAKILTYRVAATDVANVNTNTFHFNVSQVVSNTELTANSWYGTGGHLNDAGYAEVSNRIATTLASASGTSRARSRSRSR